MGHIALTPFAINALMAAVATPILDVAGASRGHHETDVEDYFADEGDPRVVKSLGAIAPVCD